jgi:UrcA family protein
MSDLTGKPCPYQERRRQGRLFQAIGPKEIAMKTYRFQSIAAASVSCFALAAIPGPAAAGGSLADRATTSQGTVSLKQVDLASAEGIGRARELIAMESRRLCRSLGDSTIRIDGRALLNDCVADAYANAMQQLELQIAAANAARVATR